MVKVVTWRRELTWRSQVGANPIPCFSDRCRTYLERSAAAHHVCTLADCFSQSSEDSPLQTLLSVIPFSVFVVPVKWLVIIGHVNRSFYLLTYLLTYQLIPYPTNFALFGHKIILYRFIKGRGLILLHGSQIGAGAESPPPAAPHF